MSIYNSDDNGRNHAYIESLQKERQDLIDENKKLKNFIASVRKILTEKFDKSSFYDAQDRLRGEFANFDK